MPQVISFFISSLLLLSCVFYFDNSSKYSNAFASRNELILKQLSEENNYVRQEAKLAHARFSDRYDIGVFGNSRSLDITKNIIANKTLTFFNFSVGGESLRNSTIVIKALYKINKLPRIVIISVDNFDLQFYPNSSAASIKERVNMWFEDAMALANTPNITFIDFARTTWRHIWTEAKLFQTVIATHPQNILINAFSIFWKIKSPNVDSGLIPRFAADGSRSVFKTLEKNSPSQTKPTEFTSSTPQIINSYLMMDLLNISQYNDRDHRIVLFESPLNPKVSKYRNDSNQHSANLNRRVFYNTCLKAGLECLQASAHFNFSERSWIDATHAPPQSFETLINYIIKNSDGDKTK